MKKKFFFGGLLLAAVTVFAFTKADPPSGQCGYRLYCLVGPGTGGEMGPTPVWCPNPAAWPFQENRCYAHWGIPNTPSPCD